MTNKDRLLSSDQELSWKMVYTRGGMWRTTIDDKLYRYPYDAQKAVEAWFYEEVDTWLNMGV